MKKICKQKKNKDVFENMVSTAVDVISMKGKKFTITVDGDFSDNELLFEKIVKVEKSLNQFLPLYLKKGCDFCG
jgi:hypothetical protein